MENLKQFFWNPLQKKTLLLAPYWYKISDTDTEYLSVKIKSRNIYFYLMLWKLWNKCYWGIFRTYSSVNLCIFSRKSDRQNRMLWLVSLHTKISFLNISQNIFYKVSKQLSRIFVSKIFIHLTRDIFRGFEKT